MTVRVRVEPGAQGPSWYYGYVAEHDLLYAKRIEYEGPLHTLQGSYDSILDQDENAEIVAAEVLVGSERWNITPRLQAPKAVPGRIYVTEDIDDGQPQAYYTDPEYTIFYTRLGHIQASDDVQHVALSDKIVLSVASDGTLVGLWLRGLPAEIATSQRESYRATNRVHNGSSRWNANE